MFHKVLIANRGAIACRIIRTLRRIGVGASPSTRTADATRCTCARPMRPIASGAARGRRAICAPTRSCEIARHTGAEAIHPGYGFLSENADFAEACERTGFAFIGPTPAADARLRPEAHGARAGGQSGVPLLPGTGLAGRIVDDACRQAGVSAIR